MALPLRKSSNPPPYATRSTRFPMVRRSRVQAIALCACAVGAVIFILSQIFGGSERIPSGTPPVVIVTVLNPELYTKEYLNNIKDNRIEYAKKHGMHGWDETCKVCQLTGYRLHDFLPNSYRLRFGRFPCDLVESSCGSTRLDQISAHNLHLVPRPEFSHYEPRYDFGRRGHESEEVGEPDDQGSASCTP